MSQAIASALAKATDRSTRLDLEDAKDQIAKTLDPKFAPLAPTSSTLIPERPGVEDDADPFGGLAPQTCWPDYTIRGLDN